MRNRFVFTSSALLLALHAFGCGASPEGETTTPTGEVSTPAPGPAPGIPTTPTPVPEPEGTPEPVPSETEAPADPSTPAPTAPPEASPAPAPSGVDGFGVTMLYPSKPGGEAWALADDATADKRFDPQGTITRNADGSWKMKSTKVRMSAYPATGYDAKQIATYDRDVLAGRGYMQAANDWKNIEMTGFVKVNAVNNTQDNFAWYARGGKHNDNSSGCEGSSYKGGLHYDGRVRWEKETWHVSYDQAPYKPATSALKGRWVGFKAVMHNVPGAKGTEAVKLELYLNDNADKVTWTKVYDMTDDGAWGGDAQHCGGSVGAMPITWGGPIATFRWDNATDVDFKWMSVREIQP
ncbi:carbohydrate-binding protein [Corallococcus carmarthensis]|uniref:Carbohydrate-binding protein n=1 Tax=Corallococcus carmarthensis TaxID=2316728 RepID=A0A3A8KF98_9BACT|nr:carbohydrate-binding protein [Corallococcus carmarthensis]RKH03005.1 carbohydrate-binding protein [Corallococcus carmarthensis]